MSARVIFQNISHSVSLFLSKLPLTASPFPSVWTARPQGLTTLTYIFFLTSWPIVLSLAPYTQAHSSGPLYLLPVAATVSPSDVHVAYFLISARSLLKCPLGKAFMIPFYLKLFYFYLCFIVLQRNYHQIMACVFYLLMSSPIRHSITASIFVCYVHGYIPSV